MSDLGLPEPSLSQSDVKTRVQRHPESMADACLWTRRQWQKFVPRADMPDGTAPGYTDSIWYEEACRQLAQLTADLENNAALTANQYHLLAVAFDYYQSHYSHTL